MSELAEAAAPRPPTTARPNAARARRVARYERERLIVDYLNRGVGVAEIAARFRVGEKRMRATIREIMDRRQPAPPREFVAIQVSRLNEALLVAYSAMTDMNLNAVDRVVKIVRELDRYHGFVPPNPRRYANPCGETSAAGRIGFGTSLICEAKLSPHSYDMIQFLPAGQGERGTPACVLRDASCGGACGGRPRRARGAKSPEYSSATH